MIQGFDVIVVGAGMMGSAAARHLAKSGASVAVIGPSEPDDKASHTGVFASHYDQARITRRLATSADWSRLSTNAINRYAEIEQESGQQFYHNVGAMMAGYTNGPESAFINKVEALDRDLNIKATRYQGQELRDHFPCFTFPEDTRAFYEAHDAGHINPRHQVQAEIIAAQRAGATYIQAEIVDIAETTQGTALTAADGSRYHAQKVIVATGGFSHSTGLLPNPVPLTVYARTITFFELDAAECARLKDMPSLIYVRKGFTEGIYALPPVLYPDGKTYIKIGGDPSDIALETDQDIKEWFRTDGSSEVRDLLAQELLGFMPELKYHSISSGSCVTSVTPTDMPLIYPQTDRIIALTGGNGAGAKCADELGRLGAMVANGQSLDKEGYDARFTPEA
ncbi:FAD-binding oxidoreductase [Roseovarius sp. EL26]|uniref:NAD(P)/FAD-dependent oxidoreductase n=1 Tax=Roseovarius sp. EL26 TaxID=2126672 RepID=UPI000EA3560D|nr:FAD-dependent oxidoreductase [Roseovarius sp. EL26]